MKLREILLWGRVVATVWVISTTSSWKFRITCCTVEWTCAFRKR